MKRVNRLKIFIFLILITVPTIISVFLITGREVYIKDISTLYNYGANSDFKKVSELENYLYDDRIWENYRFFSGMTNTIKIPVVERTHDVDEELLFESDDCLDVYGGKRGRLNPLLVKKIRYVIENADINGRSPFFKKEYGDRLIEAFEKISKLRVPVNLNGEETTLNFSEIEPELVLSIILYESGFNPYALAQERSLLDENEFVYSRGLMQIYEITLWTLNHMLTPATGYKYMADDLWSIEKNIFLGYLYLSYIKSTRL
ncbi:MAG: hypothetical protein PWQ77_1641 [Kosmotogales bacterium]|nr:hypothetical protein [Kosmotogales bacterium]